MISEMRHYSLVLGQFDRMLDRFEEVNLPLFKKYRITVERVWPHSTEPAKFLFLMSSPDTKARQKSLHGYHQHTGTLARTEKPVNAVETIRHGLTFTD